MVASNVNTLPSIRGTGQTLQDKMGGEDTPADHFFRSRLEGSRAQARPAHFAAMGETAIRGALGDRGIAG